MTNPKQKKVNRNTSGNATLLNVLRISAIPLLCIVLLYIGLWIGYVQLGGGSTSDVFSWDTWKHVIDLLFLDPQS